MSIEAKWCKSHKCHKVNLLKTERGSQNDKVLPSIHLSVLFLIPAYLLKGHKKGGPYPSMHWDKQREYPAEYTNLSLGQPIDTFTLAFRNKSNYEFPATLAFILSRISGHLMNVYPIITLVSLPFALHYSQGKHVALQLLNAPLMYVH